MEALVQLLEDSEAECRQFAADCITNMAPDGVCMCVCVVQYIRCFFSPTESLRSELITASAVPSLVSSLSFPLSSVQTSITEALGMLACDITARDQVHRVDLSEDLPVPSVILRTVLPHSSVCSYLHVPV